MMLKELADNNGLNENSIINIGARIGSQNITGRTERLQLPLFLA
jgi:hypothetical protein